MRPRDLGARMAIIQAAVVAQVQGGDANQAVAEKPKTAYLHKQGLAYQPARNTQYNGARVADVQRKMPHR